MTVSVHLQTRFAAALLAAGAVTAASLPSTSVPTISADVANASVITDALSSLGKGVEVSSSLVGIHVDATISVPFEATLALMAAQQHPELAPNVLSYLVQRFVNPAVGQPITAYPWLTEQTAALVASLLPYPLGPSAADIGLVNEARLAFADAFNSVLGQLPDPLPGYQAVQDVMNDTVVGGTVVAGQLAVRAPLYMAWSTVNYLGNLPVNVEASLESAIQAPSQIPGLVSNLVYGLLSPDATVGLLGQLLNNAVDPFTWLPAPIGYSSSTSVGLANQIRDVIVHVMNGALSLLPTPVTPSALPTSGAATAQPPYGEGAGKGSVGPDPLTTASFAVADGVSKVSTNSDDEQGKPTVLKVHAPVTSVADDAAVAAAATAELKVVKEGKEQVEQDEDEPIKKQVTPAKTEQGGASGESTGLQGARPRPSGESESSDSSHSSGDAA